MIVRGPWDRRNESGMLEGWNVGRLGKERDPVVADAAT